MKRSKKKSFWGAVAAGLLILCLSAPPAAGADRQRISKQAATARPKDFFLLPFIFPPLRE